MTVTRRILFHVALGAAVVVAVVTAVTYKLVYDALTQRDLQHLDTYVAERALREEARFQEVQANLHLVRGLFLARLEMPIEEESLAAKWDHWYLHYPDGAWRTREKFSDARKYSSLWTHLNWRDTPAHRKQILVAQDLCDELLPGWVDSFPSIFFQFHGPATIGFDARLPSWVWDMPADYDSTGLEWVELSLPADPPRDGFSWTGVQQDQVIQSPLVSVFLPIWRNGEFLGSIGHDIFMGTMLDEATHSDIPGTLHFILRADGRLIAHPTKQEEILTSKGLLTTGECGDPGVESLYQIAKRNPARRFGGYDAQGDCYYSVARLAGPEWMYITTMSRSYLQRQAFDSAQWVLWSGLVSLALVLAAIAGILRRQVARPLAELRSATEAMSAGRAVPVPSSRADELGELAMSFSEMVGKIAAREDDLRQLNLGLEQRVAERTLELEEALVRERELGVMKSNFVSLVSHEFRTPLGVIMSAADVLNGYFDRLSPEKRTRHLDMISRSTRNLASLIEEVLILGKVEDGSVGFSPVALDVGRVCRTIVDEMISSTGGSSPIEYRCKGSLEGAVSDESVLRHILTNLLSNAVKYSEPGSPVSLTLTRRGDSAVFVIRDHGIGIPESDRARLFTSFTRGSNVGQRPGTGLGLVVVQRCVQLHGGTLDLESAPCEGTTVTVSLPVFAPQFVTQ